LTDDAQAGTVMLDAEGNQVVVVPDSESWKKFEQKHKAAIAAQQEAAAGSENKELQERGLLCPIDKRLFVDPMKTPCCEKTYCHDCIENTLLDTDLVCPNCGQHSVLIDNLKTDDAMVAKIAEYEREKVEREKAAKAEKVVEKSPEPGKKEPTNSPKAESVKSPKSPEHSAGKSPSVQPSTTVSEITVGTPNAPAVPTAPSKKRPAPDDPDWSNVPTGPAAMRKQQNQPPQVPQSMQDMQPFPQQMQFPPFQQFPMGPMPGPFPMQPFQMQPQFPFNNNNNNFYGPTNGMGNMNMNMNWPQQMPFQGGPPQQNGFRQFNNQHSLQQEDSAYLRQPVNPRNQQRNKRARPCDYTTLS
jgi:protein MPE1